MNNINKLILSSFLSAHEYGNVNIDTLMNTGINKAWFEDVNEQNLFEVISICYKGGIAFDENIILEHLKRQNFKNLDNFIVDIMIQKQVPQAVLLEHIANLKERYTRRMLQELSLKIQGMVADEENRSDTIIQMVQNTLENFEALNEDDLVMSLPEIRKLRKSKAPKQRLKTYIPFIDTVLTDDEKETGIDSEGLFFISGLKESGKTFILTRIVENVSRDHPVMFGTLEFGREKYDKNVEKAEEQKFWKGDINNIHVFDAIYDTNKMIARIRLEHKSKGIKLVCIDSMMRMTNVNPDLTSEERRISEMFSKLGKLSIELSLPIIIIVQTSKADTQASTISVKGSMNADHEASVWFHLEKTHKKEHENEQRTVKWVKNKDTMKHPKQHLMFAPETKDFYRITIDEQGKPNGELGDEYRRPRHVPAVEVIYPDDMEEDEDIFSMPTL